MSRLDREKRTVAAMIALYCGAHHGLGGDGALVGGLCDACDQLRRYADLRIDRCRFHAAKPVCARCSVHCYSAERRDRIREVMRYAGPRMMLHHPFLALLHGVDSLRRPPRVSASGRGGSPGDQAAGTR